MIGSIVQHPRYGDIKIVEHIPTEWGTKSSFFRCERDGDEDVIVHENLINALVKGDPIEAFFPAAKVVAKKQTTSVIDQIRSFIDEAREIDADVSNTAIIRMITKEFGIAKATATAYFYKARKTT